MTVQEMIFQASGEENEHANITEIAENESCILCGKNITEGIGRKKIIGSNFNQRDELRAGKYICVPCANIMKGDLATQLRRSSFLVEEGRIFYFKIQQASRIVFQPHVVPFVLCITTSYKKHNAFRAVINYSDDDFIVRWEDRLINFNRQEATELHKIITKLYYGGFTKVEIRLGAFPSHRVNKFGIFRFEGLYEKIKDYFNTDLIDFLTVIANSTARAEYTKIMKRKEKENANRNQQARREGGQAALFSMEKH